MSDYIFQFDEFQSLAKKADLTIKVGKYGIVFFADNETLGNQVLGFISPKTQKIGIQVPINRKTLIDLEEFEDTEEIIDFIKDVESNFKESKKSVRKSMKESKNDIDFNNLNGFVQFKEYGDSFRGGGAFSEIKKLFEKESSFQNIVSLIKDLESDFELTKFTFSPNGEINISFKEVGGNFEFFVKYEIYRSGIGLTNLRYF